MKHKSLLNASDSPKWNEITKNKTVVRLITIRNDIENIINKLDKKALINYELWKLSQS